MQKSEIYDTYSYRTLFVGTVFIAFTVAILFGFSLPISQNCIIVPTNPFKEKEIIGTIVSICFLDVAFFWIISFPLCRFLTVASSALVFFYRGLVMGNCVGIICANSVNFEVVLMFCAYCVITLLAAMYDVMLNFYEKENPYFRFLSCMIVTGAAIVIKLSSVLIIN